MLVYTCQAKACKDVNAALYSRCVRKLLQITYKLWKKRDDLIPCVESRARELTDGQEYKGALPCRGDICFPTPSMGKPATPIAKLREIRVTQKGKWEGGSLQWLPRWRCALSYFSVFQVLWDIKIKALANYNALPGTRKLGIWIRSFPSKEQGL